MEWTLSSMSDAPARSSNLEHAHRALSSALERSSTGTMDLDAPTTNLHPTHPPSTEARSPTTNMTIDEADARPAGHLAQLGQPISIPPAPRVQNPHDRRRRRRRNHHHRHLRTYHNQDPAAAVTAIDYERERRRQEFRARRYVVPYPYRRPPQALTARTMDDLTDSLGGLSVRDRRRRRGGGGGGGPEATTMMGTRGLSGPGWLTRSRVNDGGVLGHRRRRMEGRRRGMEGPSVRRDMGMDIERGGSCSGENGEQSVLERT